MQVERGLIFLGHVRRVREEMFRVCLSAHRFATFASRWWEQRWRINRRRRVRAAVHNNAPVINTTQRGGVRVRERGLGLKSVSRRYSLFGINQHSHYVWQTHIHHLRNTLAYFYIYAQTSAHIHLFASTCPVSFIIYCVWFSNEIVSDKTLSHIYESFVFHTRKDFFHYPAFFFI